jgi:hypothetical protein
VPWRRAGTACASTRQQSPAAFSREAHVSRSNEEMPPHFLQDYTLVVEALD